MIDLQEEFRNELKSQDKLTVAQYAALYKTHSDIAIQYELDKGVSEHQAKAMGNYYTVAVLSNFVASENLLARILALHEASEEE
ncbi:hypothetical protein JHD47_02865 [Sulfurimonas sp. SAG-AH-194-L11]|nr:hypothetical protein [Sulfurimonas sp. SAG-AH-194-L11]MDF1876753.1 hypothetical protein [Sulfurimonas sp. SAG-AH-194-L11]